MKEIENMKLYTLQEVAELLGIHYQTVRKLIQNGELKAKKIGKGYIVTSENLKQYINSDD
ncbi:MAG: helix-turn-helix domain-containing protein [Clostridia bacterium]|nr:helix-turn-helix domain-containing protein [Clostridia bacterium]